MMRLRPALSKIVLLTAAWTISGWLSGSYSVAQATPQQAPDHETVAFLNEARTVESITQQRYAQIASSGEVYAWTGLGGRMRDPEYCKDQCMCVSNKMIEALRARGFEVRKLQVNAKRGHWPLKIEGAKDMFGKEPVWNYHVATAVKLSRGWFVIDPILKFDPRSGHHDTRIEHYSKWRAKIKSEVDISVTLYK